MPTILLYLLTSLLYIAGALYFRYASQRVTDQNKRKRLMAGHWLVLIPLTLHGYLLYQSLFAVQHLYLGVGNALSLIIWLSVLIYWVFNFFSSMDGLQVLMMPVAALCLLLPLIFPPTHALPNTDLPAFKLHLLISMLAYGLFTIAALHIVLMTLFEKQLHDGTVPSFLAGLPPLLTMETLLFRMIGVGFLFLTLTLASGIIFSEELFGKPLRFTHKNVFGIASWLIFAALLIGRKVYGWRGKVAVRWTLAGFVLLFLAYIGSKFVLEVVLHR